jgi:hypothetical protein
VHRSVCRVARQGGLHRTLHVLDLDSSLGSDAKFSSARTVAFFHAYDEAAPVLPADDVFVLHLDASLQASPERAYFLSRRPSGERLSYSACLMLYDRVVLASVNAALQPIVQELVRRGARVLVASTSARRSPSLEAAATGWLQIPSGRCAPRPASAAVRASFRCGRR